MKGDRCEVCGTTEDVHRIRKRQGDPLCGRCDRLLNRFNNDPERIRAVANYLAGNQ